MTRLVAVLFALTIVGCGGLVDRRDQAAAAVESYLVALAGGSADRGWSLLHPDIQDSMFDGNETRYVATAAAQDWTAFSWEVTDSWADDISLHIVELSVTDVPEFLTGSVNGFWLMGVDERNEATMSVRMPVPGRPGGIWAGGG